MAKLIRSGGAKKKKVERLLRGFFSGRAVGPPTYYFIIDFSNWIMVMIMIMLMMMIKIKIKN